MVVVSWETISQSCRYSVDDAELSVEVDGAGWGTTVDSVEGLCVGATSRILSANFAKLSTSKSSLVDANIS